MFRDCNVVDGEEKVSVLFCFVKGKRMRIVKDSEERSLFDSEVKFLFLEKGF